MFHTRHPCTQKLPMPPLHLHHLLMPQHDHHKHDKLAATAVHTLVHGTESPQTSLCSYCKTCSPAERSRCLPIPTARVHAFYIFVRNLTAYAACILLLQLHDIDTSLFCMQSFNINTWKYICTSNGLGWKNACVRAYIFLSRDSKILCI